MQNDDDDDFNLFERIDYGVRKAIANALLEHKNEGRSIVVSRDGKIIHIPAQEIEVPQIEMPAFLKGTIKD